MAGKMGEGRGQRTSGRPERMHLHPPIDRKRKGADPFPQQLEGIGAVNYLNFVPGIRQSAGEVGNKDGVTSEVFRRKESRDDAKLHLSLGLLPRAAGRIPQEILDQRQRANTIVSSNQ